MSYSQEKISKYLNILYSYKENKEEDKSHICKFLEEYHGQYLCTECGCIQGYVFNKYDTTDIDRLHYQKKSIYHRKYYFEKKVNKVSKILGLNNEKKTELYERLLELDCSFLKIVNMKFSRKRMISINFIINKILNEMGCEKINLKNSSKTLGYYEDWWSYYKEITK